MSVDQPHSGGFLDEETLEKIENLKGSTALYWDLAISQMASVEGDERTGVRFALFGCAGKKLAGWQVGEFVYEDTYRLQGHADVKCITMHREEAVCSGVVANAQANPPVYDGGVQLNNGWYLAASGLRAELDRVYCMLAAEGADMLSQLRRNTIMRKSPNEPLVYALLHEANWCTFQNAITSS